MDAADPLSSVDFSEEVPADLYCGICKDVATNPHVTEECGHLFCLACVKQSMVVSSACPICRHEGYSIRMDHRARRQIDALCVACGFAGCEWSGVLDSVRRHQEACPHRPVACSFGFAGCTALLTPSELPRHEQETVADHLKLLAAEVRGCKARQREAEAGVGAEGQGQGEEGGGSGAAGGGRNLALLCDLARLTEQLRVMGGVVAAQAERIDDLEKAAARETQQLRGDVTEVRSHLRVRAAPLVGADASYRDITADLRWRDDAAPVLDVASKYAFTPDCRRATQVTPGWGTLCCTTGLSTGKHQWTIVVGVDEGTEYTSSTVMVGVTPEKHLSTTHLGNMRHSWCFQDNGFRWDGTQCYAHGEACAAGDTITVFLDLDAGTLEFARNETRFGVAFSDVGGLLYPAVSLCTAGHYVEIEP